MVGSVAWCGSACHTWLSWAGEIQTAIVRPETMTKDVAPGTGEFISVQCESDEMVTGGGIVTRGIGKAGAVFNDNGPSDSKNGWFGQVENEGNASFKLEVTALCLKLQ